MNEAYRQRRDAVVDLLRSAGLLISIPAGAFYVMADISPTDLTSTDFAFHLLRERKVSVAPGSAFGDVARNAVRISLASSDADLEAGVSHLCKLAQELSR